MAAEPTTLSDARTMRAGTGIGIALAIAVTVGAIAFLWPRFRDEMREDALAGVGAVVPAKVALAPSAPSPSPSPAPAPAPAAAAATQPLALKPASQIVPAESLGPGEHEVAVPVQARPAPAPKSRHHGAVSAKRKKPNEPVQSARAPTPAPRLVFDDTVAGQPLRPLLPAPRARAAEPPREAPARGRLIGGLRREDPFDYRTWRMHRNPDAPPTSPVERQPG